MKHWHYVINCTDGTTEEVNLTINTTDPVEMWGDWKALRQAQGKHYVFVGYTIVSVTPLPDFIPRVRPRRIVKQLPLVDSHPCYSKLSDGTEICHAYDCTCINHGKCNSCAKDIAYWEAELDQ